MRKHTVTIAILVLTGCSSFPGLQSASAPPPIEAIHLEPAGRGLFLVRPPASSNCSVAVVTKHQEALLECDTQYLVACDDGADKATPFCALVTETGGPRATVYPGARE